MVLSLITDSSRIDDKPLRKTMKKQKNKGKKNLKCPEHIVAETRSHKLCQDFEITSHESSVKGIGEVNVADVTANCNYTAVQCQNNRKTVPPNELTNVTANSTSEACSGPGNAKIKSNSQLITLNNAHVHAVHPNELDSTTPLGNERNRLRFHHKPKIEKENGHLVGQKTRKYSRDAPSNGAKRLNHIYVPKDVKLQQEYSKAKYIPCPSNGLLPTSIALSAGHYAGSQRLSTNKQGTCGRTYCNLLVESSRLVDWWRCHSGLNQFSSEVSEGDCYPSKDWESSKQTSELSYEHVNFNTNKKGVGQYKDNLYRLRNRIILSQTESLKLSKELHHYNSRPVAQRSMKSNKFTESDKSNCLHSYPTSAHVQLNVSQTTLSGVSDCILLPAVQSCMPMKIPRTEHVLVGSLHASSQKIQRNPACLDIKHSYVYNIREDSNSRMSSQKWIPVGRKDSELLKHIEAVYACNSKATPNSCTGKAGVHWEETTTPVPADSVDLGKPCLMVSHDILNEMLIKSEGVQLEKMCTNVEVEDNHRTESMRDSITPGNKANTTPQIFIGSHMAMKALKAAYELQITSESVQLATGTPLAEFENLLQSATPVIGQASSLKCCSICMGSWHSDKLFCNHQTASISVPDVWSWYEKPGNYGLEVKTEDSRNLMGLDVNSVSFNAHFVPFLSAIQLFGHSQNFSCNSTEGHLNYGSAESGEGEGHSSCSKILKRNLPCLGSIKSKHLQIEEISFLELLESERELDNIELIFEFFEYEQPQQRKPLYDKIMELIKAGTSNHLIFGDPSCLESMNLQNLHPVSWYSVAWYPIYRIPEGNFRASFLTYHSLGYLAQRSSTYSFKEKQSWVIAPVLGLQSYNAQGECWFSPKLTHESYSKGSLPFNNSEILKERLRTLEETALLFARGSVFKEHTKVGNRQPDFEFFLSRKC